MYRSFNLCRLARSPCYALPCYAMQIALFKNQKRGDTHVSCQFTHNPKRKLPVATPFPPFPVPCFQPTRCVFTRPASLTTRNFHLYTPLRSELHPFTPSLPKASPHRIRYPNVRDPYLRDTWHTYFIMPRMAFLIRASWPQSFLDEGKNARFGGAETKDGIRKKVNLMEGTLSRLAPEKDKR